MKTRMMITVCLLALTWGAMAQPPREDMGHRRQQMESARIAYLTDRLEITPEQAQAFWPLYNELEDKRRAIREDMMKFRADMGEEITDAQAKQLIDKHLEMRQKELNLEKEYTTKMMEVLTPQQVVRLVKSEEDFRQFIISELRDRRRDERHEGRREGRDERHEGRDERQEGRRDGRREGRHEDRMLNK